MQCCDADQTTYTFDYTRTDELKDATLKDTAGNILKSYSYGYDAAGNRVRKTVDSTLTTYSHNNLNQLTQAGGSGTIAVEGTVDEPASVTVNGQPAKVTSLPGSNDFRFEKQIKDNKGTQRCPKIRFIRWRRSGAVGAELAAAGFCSGGGSAAIE